MNGYALPQIGCVHCGKACDPLCPRCPACKQEPYADVTLRVGPLSKGRLWYNLVLLVSTLWGAVQYFRVRGGLNVPQNPLELSDWLLVGLDILLLYYTIAATLRMVKLWQASRMCLLVLGQKQLVLIRKMGKTTYLFQLSAQEIGIPLPPAHHLFTTQFPMVRFLLNIFLLFGVGCFHWLSHILLEPVHEVNILLKYGRNQVQRFIYSAWFVETSKNEIVNLGVGTGTAVLTMISLIALKQWIAEGLVQLEQGYEPSPERPVIIVDLMKRCVRAYALSDVETYLKDDDENEEEKTQQTGEPERIPLYALPYEDRYWIRAGWNLIDEIELRFRARQLLEQEENGTSKGEL